MQKKLWICLILAAMLLSAAGCGRDRDAAQTDAAAASLYDEKQKPDPSNLQELEIGMGDSLSAMACDYQINNGELQLTRDFGESWIETDITAAELQETLRLHRSNFSLPEESLFLTVDVNMPIAFF